MQSNKELLNTLHQRVIAAALLSLAMASVFALNGSHTQIVSSGLIALGEACIGAALLSGRCSIEDVRLAAYVLGNYGLITFVCLVLLSVTGEGRDEVLRAHSDAQASGHQAFVDGLAGILRDIPVFVSGVVAAVGAYLLWKEKPHPRHRKEAEVCPVEYRGPGISDRSPGK